MSSVTLKKISISVLTIHRKSLWLNALLFCFCAGTAKAQKQGLPNIVLINIDDLGWKDVGFMGSEFYQTPVMDELVAQGTKFTNAYAAASNCAPSRASMMTGQWTPRHGIYTVENSDRGKSRDRKLIPIRNTTVLAKEKTIIPEVLKRNGYVTCIAGKWHLSGNPKERGFDVNIGGSHSGNPGSYRPPYTNVKSLQPPTKDYYLTNLIMDKTLDFITSVGNKPFFLYYAPYAVHTPIQAVDSLLPHYKLKNSSNGQSNPAYATMIENADAQIGRLLQQLKRLKKMDHTLFILTSDNGGVYKVTKQWPLRAGKGSYYEGGIRVPMAFIWKGHIKEGGVSDNPVSHLDIFPTLVSITGAKSSKELVLDGTDLIPLLNGKKLSNDRSFFWHFPIYLEGGDVECQDTIFRTRPGSAVRKGNWKLIQYFENNDLELYNLKTDQGEKNNLVQSNPAKAKELLLLLRHWRQKVSAPIPDLLNPNFNGQK